MSYLTHALRGLFSISLLFLLTKLIGRRQMSQLSMFDYIVGISIGSVAAEVATHDDTITSGIIAMIVYTAVTILFAVISNRFIGARKFIEGKSSIIFEDGKFHFDNMKKARLDMHELLMQARIAGYFDLSKIKIIMLEANGQLSFLPYGAERPATPKDMTLTVTDDYLQYGIIVDGSIQKKVLSLTKMTEKQLLLRLKEQKTELHKVALATLSADGKLSIFKKL